MGRLSKLTFIVILSIGIMTIVNSCKKIRLPELTTASVTNITTTSAVSGGNITNNGGDEVTVRGVCWSTIQNPDIGSNKTNDGVGIGTFTSNLTGLTANTNYYVRAYATNGEGTAYGQQVTFTTNPIVVPTVTTTAPTSITSNSAVSGGNVTNNGGAEVTARGVCWSTTQNPTITNDKTTDGSGTGIFTSNLTNLQPGTTYYVRAYATNSAGTGYDTDPGITFTTQCLPPTAATDPATGIGSTTATMNGVVNANYSSTTVTFEYGLSDSYGNSVTATQSPVTGSSNTAVSAGITGLIPGTTYHYRIKAVNCGGTTNGSDRTFTPQCVAPSVVTNPASGVGTTTATLNGTINANHSSTTVTFELGITNNYGTVYSATQSPVTGNSNTAVSTGITGLMPGTTYHFKVKGVNCGGTSNGSDQTFTTGCTAPVVTTNPVSGVGTTTATLNGTVNASNSSTTVTFEYGTTTGYGNTADATPSPVTGTGNTNVSAGITGLIPGTTYHYRAVGVNCGGATNGSDLTFTTDCEAPAATTNPATGIGTITATLNGTINANYSSTTVTFEFGTSTSYGTTATATQSPVTGNNNTSVSAGISGLTPGTVYHFRVVGVNCGGTTNGSDQTFTSGCTSPDATTDPATGIGSTTATLNGVVNANNSSTTVTFEYGLTAGYGSIVTASPSPVNGTSNTNVTASLTGLTPGTTYHFRVKGSNCGGTANGSDRTFITSCIAPTVTTNPASSITSTTATLNGTVNANFSSTTVTFEYGISTSYGSTITAIPSPVTGSSNTSVAASISGLAPGTIYHFRIKGVNCGGTTNGSDRTFTTNSVKSILQYTGISKTFINLTSSTVLGQITINPLASGKVIVSFDGLCISTPGDRIVLAASNTTSWGINDGSVGVEAYSTDFNGNTFSHTRVYDVTPGSHTYYAVAQNYVETSGDGIASIYGSLTVEYIPASNSIVGFSGVSRTNVNLNSLTTISSNTINPTVSGKTIVRFDGSCISTPGDAIVLAASNTTSWGINDGNVYVEAVNSDINQNSFSHTRVYDVTSGSRTFNAVGQNYVESDGDGIASIYGSLLSYFVPTSGSGLIVGFAGIDRTFVNLNSSTVLGQVTINPSVSGKVLVRFDGECYSSPGDRIVLAASNTTSWGINDGNTAVEAINSDLSEESFSHTRVYNVSSGSHTFYAIGHNYAETAGDGIASVYGSLTVVFYPD